MRVYICHASVRACCTDRHSSKDVGHVARRNYAASKDGGGATTKGKELRVGERFQMNVAETITVDGNIVIPVGSLAIGKIIEVAIEVCGGSEAELTAVSFTFAQTVVRFG